MSFNAKNVRELLTVHESKTTLIPEVTTTNFGKVLNAVGEYFGVIGAHQQRQGLKRKKRSWKVDLDFKVILFILIIYFLALVGVGNLADSNAFNDPEVLRRLTSSVSCALDEAAAALTRMRAQKNAIPCSSNHGAADSGMRTICLLIWSRGCYKLPPCKFGLNSVCIIQDFIFKFPLYQSLSLPRSANFISVVSSPESLPVPCQLVWEQWPVHLESICHWVFLAILLNLKLKPENIQEQSHHSNFDRFIPINGGGQIYLTLAAISNSLSPSCSIHGIIFLQTNMLLLHLRARVIKHKSEGFYFLLSHFRTPCIIIIINLKLELKANKQSQYSARKIHSNHWCKDSRGSKKQ